MEDKIICQECLFNKSKTKKIKCVCKSIYIKKIDNKDMSMLNRAEVIKNNSCDYFLPKH